MTAYANRETGEVIGPVQFGSMYGYPKEQMATWTNAQGDVKYMYLEDFKEAFVELEFGLVPDPVVEDFSEFNEPDCPCPFCQEQFEGEDEENEEETPITIVCHWDIIGNDERADVFTDKDYAEAVQSALEAFNATIDCIYSDKVDG